jgi:hypothetical protein
MTDMIKIEAFIEAQAKEGKHVRLTIEYSETTRKYTARLVDQHYGSNIAMLDVNDAHYLLDEDRTIEYALAGLAVKVELQYC